MAITTVPGDGVATTNAPRAALGVHFELHALRLGHWKLDACFTDEHEARAAMLLLTGTAGVARVRLVREVALAGRAAPETTVLSEMTAPVGPLTKAPTLRPTPVGQADGACGAASFSLTGSPMLDGHDLLDAAPPPVGMGLVLVLVLATLGLTTTALSVGMMLIG